MEELERRLVVFESRIEELESAVERVTDNVLQLENILTSIAQHLMPGENFEEEEEK